MPGRSLEVFWGPMPWMIESAALMALPVYANSEFFMSEVLSLVKNAPAPIRWFVVRCDSIADIDYSSARMLGGVIERMRAMKTELALADVGPDIAALPDRYGLAKDLGPEMIFTSIDAALSEYKSSRG